MLPYPNLEFLTIIQSRTVLCNEPAMLYTEEQVVFILWQMLPEHSLQLPFPIQVQRRDLNERTRRIN